MYHDIFPVRHAVTYYSTWYWYSATILSIHAINNSILLRCPRCAITRVLLLIVLCFFVVVSVCLSAFVFLTQMIVSGHISLGRRQDLAANEVLRRNRRLRVYAKEVDHEGLRIKLTCKRPRSRPRCGPESALASDRDVEDFEYDDTYGAVYDDDDWEEGGEEEEEEDDEDEDDDGGDWFYPDRGEFIPAPETDFA